MNDASRVAGAGVVISAGIAATTWGAANAAGQTTAIAIAGTRQLVRAGSEGWDEDGNFVCSLFMFNFRTMEVFDGSETHSISDITDYSCDGARVCLYLKGRAQPKIVGVGHELRAATVDRLLSAMLHGEVCEPDGKARLRSPERRMRMPGFGTFLRYGARSIFLGMLVWFVIKCSIDDYGAWYFYEYLDVVKAIFLLSFAWRLLRPLKLPRWREA